MKFEMKKKLLAFLHPLRTHYEERYRKRYRNARIFFIVDLVLLGVILALGSTTIFLLASSRIINVNFDVQHRAPSALLRMRIDTPPNIFRGSETDIAISYENIGAATLQDVTLSFEASVGIEFTDQGIVRQIGDVGAGASGTLHLVGIVRESSARLVAEATAERAGRKILAGSIAETIKSVPSGITVSHRYLGAETVRPGDTLLFEVGYENNGSYTIEHAALGLHIENPGLVEWARASGAKRLSDTFFGVSAVELPALAQSRSGTSFSVSVPTLSRIPKTAVFGGRNGVLRVRARLTGTIDGTPVAFVGKMREIKVASALSVEAFARYYSPDGDQLGRGSLPPVSGETTKLWIIWHIQNTTNEVRNVRVEGRLPPNVEWTQRASVTSGGAVSYDRETRRVAWIVESVPSFPDEAEPLGASFEVAITPTAAMVGTTPTLLQDVTIRGEDAFTGLTLEARGAFVTTDLTHDIFGRSKGTVQE
ncbi:MAG: hypothetical protein AAB562_01175 [Patescibacteria group bacterium]